MKRMQCEICGGTDIRKSGENVFECQDCGIQYSVEEAVKLIQGESEKTVDPEEEPADDMAAPSLNMQTEALDGLAALRVENALREGNKLKAIQIYRDATGAGLESAKKQIDTMMKANRR